ncbi:hypothetical protein [Candidatus Nitronereus thalassa]|uniref:Uncharacterized protein n=1 Tax=Candidatus Nitronereus thalassa TaxID=3020898 RepID=A0ABU3K3A5_9BACT|nr:hypothetical protein [Candidatus Nitronereus thalassa]MDT7040878.1 hypothetical protein [Candidatus Nitronereus thalassa]
MTESRGVKFELELDRPRTFTLTMGNIYRTEKLSGQSFFRGQIGLTDLVPLLFACQNPGGPRLKMEAIPDLIAHAGMAKVFGVVADAISDFLGEEAEVGAGESAGATATAPTPDGQDH